MGKAKELSPEKIARRKAAEARELERLRKEQAKPKGSGYMIYFIMIITVVYLVDEIASQIGTQMQTIVASEIFAPVFGAEYAMARMGSLGMIGIIITVLAFLYKPLSDRYGRRIFLVANTLGMGLGMLFVGIATNIPVYFLGAWVTAFFTPHDMQAVYIYESTPAKHRAKIYSIIKGMATLGMFLIPFLRNLFITETDQSGWRFVYIIPGIIGLAVSIAALFLVRESDAFVESRIHQLTMTEEEKEAAKAKNQDAEARGGLGKAFKFIFRHGQLRYLCIAYGFMMFGMLIAMYYETTMTYGYAQSFQAAGMEMEAARQQAIPMVTAALMTFPLASAVIQILQGFFSDTLGRKPALLSMSIMCLVSYLLFFAGAKQSWNPYFVGVMAGLSVGSYWGAGDINGIMITESAPTNLRLSILTLQPVIGMAIFALGMIGYLVAINLLGDAMIGIICFAFAVPGLAIGILLVMFKTKETRGVDLGKVSGDEF